MSYRQLSERFAQIWTGTSRNQLDVMALWRGDGSALLYAERQRGAYLLHLAANRHELGGSPRSFGG